MELERKEDEEHEYNGEEADEDDTIIAHSPQRPVHSPQRSLPNRNTELQVQAHWERVIREQFAASMHGEYVRVTITRLHQRPNNVNANTFHRRFRLWLYVVLRLQWYLTLTE